MSVNEILAEMDKLSPDELKIIWERLDLVREDFEETPEMLAAIDEGLRSLREEGSIPIEEVERRMKSWTFKSP
jgi:BMFP domain-containing protein YqiC